MTGIDEGLAAPLDAVLPGGRLDVPGGARCALVVVDMTHWDAARDFGFGRLIRANGVEEDGYWDRVEQEVVPNTVRLLERFRAVGSKIVFLEAGGHFGDLSDTSPNCRQIFKACNASAHAEDGRTLRELAPRPGEAVLVKASSSGWTSTPIDYLLRQAGVTSVFFAGVVTNGCVLTSALAAWDHGYDVHVVEDATACLTPRQQAVALEAMSFFNIGIWSTAQVDAALARPAAPLAVADPPSQAGTPATR